MHRSRSVESAVTIVGIGNRPEQSYRLAQNRKKERDRTRIPKSTWARVEQLLREDWSPEQVSGWLAQEEGTAISHEWIYWYVYEDKRRGGDLHRHLRCQKPRRKRYGHYDRRGQIRERVSIDERPEVVEARSRIGDWEADTVIGKPGGAVLVTLVERRSRLSLIALAPNKTAEAVKAAIVLQPPVGPSAYVDLRQWQGVRLPHGDRQGVESRWLLRPPLSFLRARLERKHQRAYPAVPVQGNRLQSN